MVSCERCYRKFPSYAALLQHHKDKHPNVTKLTKLESQVESEKEAHSLYEASVRSHGPSRIKLLAFVLIVIVAISVSSYVTFTPKPSIQSEGNSIGTGLIAADFSLPATTGGTFKLSDYRGKSNVLLFFNEGLSCQPCLAQMQGLDALNANFKNLNIVAISITADPPQVLSQWVQSGGPRYGMVLSDQGLQVSRMYDMLGPNVSMMPGSAPGHSFVLVNKDGVIVWRHDYGPYNMSVTNDEIIAAVKQALGT